MSSTSFFLTQEDIDAFVKYSLRRARKDFSRFLLPVATIAGVGCFLFLYFQSDSWAAALIFAAIVMFVVCIPLLFGGRRWTKALQRTNSRSVQWTLGPQSLATDSNCITISSTAGTEKVSWSSIDQLIITDSHAFLIFPHLHAWILPLKSISTSDRESLLADLRAGVRPAGILR